VVAVGGGFVSGEGGIVIIGISEPTNYASILLRISIKSS
jgi:hypothetical protein